MITGWCLNSGILFKKLKLIGCTVICLLIVVMAFFMGNEYVNAETVFDGDY